MRTFTDILSIYLSFGCTLVLSYLGKPRNLGTNTDAEGLLLVQKVQILAQKACFTSTNAFLFDTTLTTDE